jgi:hypothetical protein
MIIAITSICNENPSQKSELAGLPIASLSNETSLAITDRSPHSLQWSFSFSLVHASGYLSSKAIKSPARLCFILPITSIVFPSLAWIIYWQMHARAYVRH